MQFLKNQPFLFVPGLVIVLLFYSCAFKSVTRYKNILYVAADSNNKIAAQKLNVFAPHRQNGLRPVLVFIYGGNWNSGRRGLYSFLGNRMARKSIVTVIIDYPKSPKANYDVMATDAALAVKWVQQNISSYGGNPEKIFISGHSAGGHLASLISVRNYYFEKIGITNPIKGTLLIDAAGIDMYGYLKAENFAEDHTYIKTFSNDPVQWKKASTLYHLHKGMPPMLIYVGAKTYPSIMDGNTKLWAALKNMGYVPDYHILKGKRHVAMITQFFNSYNPRYKAMIAFMQKNAAK